MKLVELRMLEEHRQSMRGKQKAKTACSRGTDKASKGSKVLKPHARLGNEPPTPPPGVIPLWTAVRLIMPTAFFAPKMTPGDGVGGSFFDLGNDTGDGVDIKIWLKRVEWW